MSACLSLPIARTIISSPSQLAYPTPSSFVRRNGTRLTLDGADFKAVGPNVYWLGLDENVQPNPSWPSRGRVLEVMAIASAMGATTIRSTTLGVSTGPSSLSIESSLGQVNEAAFAAVDWAVWAAKSYGLRLIIPLTDQYDYYHGGIPSFLRFRNLSSNDHSPFYDTTGVVFSDFKNYVRILLSHRSNITGLTLAEEPTVLAFETGNELGGWGMNSYPPSIEWVGEIAAYLKELAPETLVLSGTYGVREAELPLVSVDIYSDHYYPPYSYNLRQSGSLAHAHDKVFLVGEFDWTDQYYFPLVYLSILAPAVLAAGIWLLPVLLICPILGGVIHAFLPTPLSSFLSTIEDLSASSTLAGSFYWSLFGRDNNCCAYVQHDDGYTLHYPSAPGALSGNVEGRVVALTRHAWRMRDEDPSWLIGDFGKLDVKGLPGIQCPQDALTVPANATWAGRL